MFEKICRTCRKEFTDARLCECGAVNAAHNWKKWIELDCTKENYAEIVLKKLVELKNKREREVITKIDEKFVIVETTSNFYYKEFENENRTDNVEAN